MKNYFLIPSYYKMVGWITFSVFAILGFFVAHYDFQIPGFQIYDRDAGNNIFSDYNLTNEFALTGIITGLLMICFARNEIEDEYITQVRLNCWQWSVVISYAILLIFNFAFYGMGFVAILIYNMFTLPIVFIGKFYYSMYKFNKSAKLELNN